MVLLEDKQLNHKAVQAALRQILGTYVSVDVNFKNLFNTLSDGISLGMLVSCTTGELHNLNEVSVLRKSLPYILELCKIIATEMDTIIHDDNLDQVTVLATKVLEALMKSQQNISN